MIELQKERESENKAFTKAPSGEKGVLYIGIDLGTSRTSIAASNGIRETVVSMVGYPKDVISKKLLKKDVLFGQEVLDHRLALDVIRPLEKGVIKYSDTKGEKIPPEEVERYKKAAKELLRYAVSLAKPQPGDVIYGVIGAPAKASIVNKQVMIELARDILDAVMIVSEPFAVAYGMDQLENAMIVDIGAGTVDLCRMHGTLPDESDQMMLTCAGDYLDELLLKKIKEAYPDAQVTINMARTIKERFGYTPRIKETVKVKLLVKGKPTVLDLTEQVKEACSSNIQPITEAIQELISTFDPEFQEKIRNNVILAGGGSQMKGLDVLLEDALAEYGGGKVWRVDEPVYAGANGALKLAYDMPEEYWKALS